jgi:hypothetical protein
MATLRNKHTGRTENALDFSATEERQRRRMTHRMGRNGATVSRRPDRKPRAAGATRRKIVEAAKIEKQ